VKKNIFILLACIYLCDSVHDSHHYNIIEKDYAILTTAVARRLRKRRRDVGGD